MSFFRLTVKATLSELSFSNALRFWCGFLYKFRSTIENQHGRRVGDPLSFEIPMDVSLETSRFLLENPYFHLRPPKFSLETPVFSLETPIFSLETPYFFVGHPILSSKTQIFSLENPRFSSDLQRKIGVSNENMGVSNRFSPTKIWGLQRESGGLQRDVHRGLQWKGAFSLSPFLPRL